MPIAGVKFSFWVPLVSKMGTMANVNDYAQAFNEAVAAELVAYRAGARWTQKQLIDATGISKSKMIRIEAARIDIGSRDIALITDALGVEPHELMARATARLEKARLANADA